MNDRGLSKLQKAILCELWRVSQLEQRPGGPHTHWGVTWRQGSTQGIPIHRRVVPDRREPLSASQRAADSRALRRLEARGLVERVNAYSYRQHHTMWVILSADGRTVAQRLTS